MPSIEPSSLESLFYIRRLDIIRTFKSSNICFQSFLTTSSLSNISFSKKEFTLIDTFWETTVRTTTSLRTKSISLSESFFWAIEMPITYIVFESCSSKSSTATSVKSFINTNVIRLLNKNRNPKFSISFSFFTCREVITTTF